MTTLPLAVPAAATPGAASGTGSAGSRTSGSQSQSAAGFGALLADAMSEPAVDSGSTPATETSTVPVPDGTGERTELVDGLLGTTAADTPTTTPGEQGLPADPADATGEGAGNGQPDAEGQAGDEHSSPAATQALLLSPLPFSLAEAVRLGVSGASATGGAATSGALPGTSTAAPTTDPTSLSPVPSVGSPVAAAQLPGSPTGSGGTPTGVLAGTGHDLSTGTSPDLLPTSPAVAEAPARSDVGPAASSGTASATGVDISTLTPVGAPSGTSSAPTSAASAPAPAPAPVAQQVLPEVSRLVQRGDGTHRLTLTLTPEALGDVRVTLTVRQGEVSVTFAAGDEARRALIESTPELRRLLELSGATASRVTVGDLGGGRPGDGAGQGSDGWLSAGDDDRSDARSDTQQGTRDGARTGDPGTPGAGHPQDHHARTRGGINATDGTHRGTGDTGRPLDPGTSSRPAGLDVTV